jgi:hypothetical protein
MPGTPATTPRLGIPRYAAADAADFPTQYNAGVDQVDLRTARWDTGTLSARPAAAINGRMYYANDVGRVYLDNGSFWIALNAPTASSFPSSPVADQEVFINAFGGMGTERLLWHFRYDVSQPGAYKWNFVGGADFLASAALITMTIPPSVFTTLPTVAFSPPAPGVYLATAVIWVRNSGGSPSAWFAHLKDITDGTAVFPVDAMTHHVDINNDAVISQMIPFTVLATPHTIRLEVGRNTGATAGILLSAYLSVRPIRLG